MNAPAQAPQSEAATEADNGPTMAVLHSRWCAAHEQMEQEYARLEQASAAAAELYPPRPPFNDPAHTHWECQARAIESSFGIPGLTECAERAYRAADGLAKTILSMTAQTPSEVAIKYELMLQTHGNGVESGEIAEGAPFFEFLTELRTVMDKYQALTDIASVIIDLNDVIARNPGALILDVTRH